MKVSDSEKKSLCWGITGVSESQTTCVVRVVEVLKKLYKVKKLKKKSLCQITVNHGEWGIAENVLTFPLKRASI